MKRSFVGFAGVLAVLTLISRSMAQPVTSPEAPSSGPIQTGLWLQVGMEAPFFERDAKGAPRSPLVRMLRAVDEGKLGPGVGWFGPSQRRHDWAWLAQKFDADGDGKITAKEFTSPGEFFAVLDRDRDGVVTSADLDWSERSVGAKQDDLALKLFRAIDANGDGRISEGEWQTYFKRASDGKGHLTPEDLQKPLSAKAGKGTKVAKDIWLRCLFAGDLGSAFEGPNVGKPAPDFTLPTHDQKRQITLSHFHGKKPIVLIFGSFT